MYCKRFIHYDRWMLIIHTSKFTTNYATRMLRAIFFYIKLYRPKEDDFGSLLILLISNPWLNSFKSYLNAIVHFTFVPNKKKLHTCMDAIKCFLFDFTCYLLGKLLLLHAVTTTTISSLYFYFLASNNYAYSKFKNNSTIKMSLKVIQDVK